ncbi:MAG: DUF3791 domain-containing protein [Duncaniella sp.]|nr:DUF3791 domain-containing protein [Bacteroides sp.]MDE6812515.1 DUF3791 domain-containing protein [Duncaniella sp.]MBD5319073.1 DUF3791 domain-containing protein [Bacteroides sp.]MBD5354852.1 DUF3791 domain-containing protein [Bacteroides sp.]MDE6823322.1 DUF3791 domain-containing protein [Duncaniella sp.]
MTFNQLDFVTYCIGSVAEGLNIDQPTVYKMLKDSGILYGYIVPAYDVLHTYSGRRITEEITEIMHERGVLK